MRKKQISLFWIKQVAGGLALTVIASLATFQAAQAGSTWDLLDYEHHGDCDGGSTGCVTTNGSKSFYAFESDLTSATGMMDGDAALNTRNVSIDYVIGAGWLIDNAWLWIKAKDDAATRYADSTQSGRDGYEYLDLLSVEGQAVQVGSVEVDSNWYFGFNVKSFVLGSNTSPLSAMIAAINLPNGDSDFIFQNAKLRLDYHTVDCPPPTATPLPAAGWLFGSALLGFVTLSNRRKV